MGCPFLRRACRSEPFFHCQSERAQPGHRLRKPRPPHERKEARENGPASVPPAETLRLSKSSGGFSGESQERGSTLGTTAEPGDP